MTIDTRRAARLQDLFVRLLFCDVTFDRYRADPASLVAEFGLGRDVLTALPDPGTPQLAAERHGRRTSVEREIRKVFGQSYTLIANLPGFVFGDFLCSDGFYDPRTGLPHPFGSGPGYENASKFFFWAKRNIDFDGPPDGARARWTMHGDFAAHLLEQYRRGAEDYYRRFARGIFWRERPDMDLPVTLMTANRRVYRIAAERQRQETIRSGAADLDNLAPPPAPAEDNIR